MDRHEGDMQVDSLTPTQESRGSFRVEEERIFSLLFCALIAGISCHDLPQSQKFVCSVSKHFAVVLGDPVGCAQSDHDRICLYSIQAQSNVARFDPLTYLDALLSCARHQDAPISATAWVQFRAWLDDLTLVAGIDVLCRSHNAIQHIFSQAGHFCHFADGQVYISLSQNCRFSSVSL
jgi:hypothetical protein